MSRAPAFARNVSPGATRAKATRKTRRRFLKAVALGLPLAAGAAAGLGRAASDAKETHGAFPGDPAAWRQQFLADARAVKTEGVAEADVAVRDRAQGVILTEALPRLPALPAPAPAVASAAADESILARMQEDLQRVLAKRTT